MKQTLSFRIAGILAVSIISVSSAKAQNNFAGTWEGEQTNMQGYYPANIRFELTGNKEFLLKDWATNTVKYKGTYTVSGNSVTGTYLETNGSMSSVVTFAGSFDAGTKKMTCTYGYGSSTRLGKWTMVQKTFAAPVATATPSYITADDSKYYLEAASVTLVTGNDNKDKGAQLIVKLYPNFENTFQFQGYWLDNFTDEIKKGQWWSNSLPRAPKFSEANNTLALYKKYGIALEIWYNSYGGPFPLTDAWKLDKVLLDLQFFNYIGQKHPQYGNLHLEIPAGNLLFTAKTCLLRISTDGYFKPLAPYVRNDCKQY